ncbi:MAG: sulfite oxidase heme-binding subunit YedZ [Anaerolineae bacterium]
MAALSLNNISKKQQLQGLKVITHIGSLIPLIWLYFDYYTYNLGVEEVNAAILRTGYPAVFLLVLSLAVTPLNTLFGWSILGPLRKPLGLYAFMYASLHLLIFAALDYGLEWSAIITEITSRWYATIGFASLLIMLPLALTSTKWAMRKLGKRWKSLHKIVYVSAILAVYHYFLQARNDYNYPIAFAVALTIFLVLRFDVVKSRVVAYRKERAKAAKAKAKADKAAASQ